MTTEELYTTYVSCAIPFVGIDTVEDMRATALIKSCIEKLNEGIFKGEYCDVDNTCIKDGFTVYTWDGFNGIRDIVANKPIEGTVSFGSALERIANTKYPAIFILYNIHLSLQDRFANSIFIPQLKTVCKESPKYNVQIVGIGNMSMLPEELKDVVTFLDFNYPTKEELYTEIHNLLYDEGGYFTTYKHSKDKQSRICNDVAMASVGMTMNESILALRLAIGSPKRDKNYHLDLQAIYDAKARCITSAGFLEYLDVKEDDNSLGGMSNLKEWVTYALEKIFKAPEKAAKFGLKMPKGIILTGIQGTGKTLAAKWLSKKLQIKCYRCDIGRVFGSLVGDTERNMRTLLKQLKVIQPAIILFDEIEKMMAGQESSTYTDSGVTSRMIASFLYDTEESNNLSFKVATANNVFALSPEMLRKGRWDEIFFFDTPSIPELIEIYKIHIAISGRNPNNFDVETFAKKSVGFVGAEVESVIQLALRKAFTNDTELSNELILTEISKTKPLTVLKKDEIDKLRAWAKDKTQLANNVTEHPAKVAVTVPLMRSRSSKLTN